MAAMHDISPDPECAAVLEKLFEFLDGECSDPQADEIRSHLDACDRCVEDADVALALKALVKRCCGSGPAPASLRASIMTQYSRPGLTVTRYTEVTQVRPPLS